jgi:hypothetical protein
MWSRTRTRAKRTLRLLLGVWSPSLLATGEPFELALLWMVHRLSRRFRAYRALFGEVQAGALAHLRLWHMVRGFRAGLGTQKGEPHAD